VAIMMMNIRVKPLNFPGRYWAYLALLIWGSSVFLILQKTPYGADEGGARALLLVWSVADRVVTPVVTFGVPDFRAIFYIPVGILWTGNVLAARIFSILITALAIWIIYKWRDRAGENESALLASGLFLISPLIVNQIDTLAIVPFLLFCFASGAWLDQRYRQEQPRLFGGLHFFQMFLCAVSTTLHPAGMAYPAVLAWSWYKNPPDQNQQKYFLGGIALATALALLLTLGWHDINWFTNPVVSLSNAIMGIPLTEENSLRGIRGAIGSGALLILLLVVWRQFRELRKDFLGRILLVGLVLSLMAGDEAWSALALSICLYWGLPLLMRSNISGGFIKQRGMALTTLFILSMAFTASDKARYQQLQGGFLSPSDALIKTLVESTDVSKHDTSNVAGGGAMRVASQWPGRTMLACGCDALPLPPPVEDENILLTMMHGISYLMFDPKEAANGPLARDLAMLGGEKTETIAVRDAGVIIRIKDSPPARKKTP